LHSAFVLRVGTQCKGGGGQKEKQMYNNETATNNITKKKQFIYLHIYYLQHFSPKISLSSKRKSILD